MKQTITQVKQITHIGEPRTRLLSQVDRRAHLTSTLMSEQFLLAGYLLRIESIQRDEALEAGEAIHRVTRPPSKVTLITDFRRTA